MRIIWAVGPPIPTVGHYGGYVAGACVIGGIDEGYLLHDGFIDGSSMRANNEYVVAANRRDLRL